MSQGPYSLSTVRKALAVLSVFEEAPPQLSLTEISVRVGEPVTVVFRILRTLCEAGYLEVDPATKRYSLGIRIWQLAERAMDRPRFVDTVRPHLEALTLATQETATLAVARGTSLVYLSVSDGIAPLRAYVQLGAEAPLYPAASGRVLLAFDEADLLGRVIAEGLSKITEATVTDPEELRARVEAVRAEGFAIVHEEYQPHLSSIAVPVLDESEACVAAIAVSGPTHRFEEPKRQAMLKSMLMDVADRVRQGLGRRGGDTPDAPHPSVAELEPERRSSAGRGGSA